MPYKNNHPRPGDQSKKPKKKSSEKTFSYLSDKNKLFNQVLKLIRFENSLAVRVQEEDIIRACSLYNKTQEKIIRLKIAKIHFN